MRWWLVPDPEPHVLSAVVPLHRRPTAGVAMCVYNGAKYLREQLDSIARQSELPRSMVVIDDGSSDGSWELLTDWAAKSPFAVHLHRNTTNLGVVKNFERAIGMTSEDVVFLSDQDDVWRRNKIATFLDAFSARPDVQLIHSDADLIDSEGRPLQRRLFDTLLVTPRERALVNAGQAYRVYVKRNLVTGASCAFRRELLGLAAPFSPEWVHDEWLAFAAALGPGVALLAETTMSYRLHSANVVGIPITNWRWRLTTSVNALLQPSAPAQGARAVRLRQIQLLAHRLDAPAEAMSFIDRAARHAEFRAALPKNPFKRIRGIFREARQGNYHEWSGGEASMVHDLFLAN
ncbi:MAG: glycosyltransferase family 2 protein [Comamonadaceae bacterium]|nr:MAG: glycosyltransferase family 2 protein [Comamonadaceae bacterium]